MRRALLEKFMQRSPRGIILFRVRRARRRSKRASRNRLFLTLSLQCRFLFGPRKDWLAVRLTGSQFYARRLPLNFAAPSVVSSSV